MAPVQAALAGRAGVLAPGGARQAFGVAVRRLTMRAIETSLYYLSIALKGAQTSVHAESDGVG